MDTNTQYLLRTVRPDGISAYGFVWPLEEGAIAVAPDWDPAPECGGGLHGLPGGRGDAWLLDWSSNAVWLVVEALGAVVDLDGKAKTERARVVHVGDQHTATRWLQDHGAVGPIVGATVTGGDWATVTGGDRATVTGGDRATVTGGDRATVIGGYGATVIGGYGATVIGGYGATVIGGVGATVTGGKGAVLICRWNDHGRNTFDVAVACVGEGGILPGVAYRVDGQGQFVTVEA